MAPMMQRPAMSRVFSGAGSAGPRRLAMIGGTAVVLLAAVAVVVMHGHHRAPQATVAKLPDVNAEPGGMHSNPYYDKLAIQQAQQQAQAAAAAGQSSVAPMVAGTAATPPVAQPVAVAVPPVAHPIVRPVAPAHLEAKPVTYTPPQPAQAVAPDPQQQKQQSQLYAAAIGSMMAGWGTGPAPLTQVYIDPSKSSGPNSGRSGAVAHWFQQTSPRA